MEPVFILSMTMSTKNVFIGIEILVGTDHISSKMNQSHAEVDSEEGTPKICWNYI